MKEDIRRESSEWYLGQWNKGKQMSNNVPDSIWMWNTRQFGKPERAMSHCTIHRSPQKKDAQLLFLIIYLSVYSLHNCFMSGTDYAGDEREDPSSQRVCSFVEQEDIETWNEMLWMLWQHENGTMKDVSWLLSRRIFRARRSQGTGKEGAPDGESGMSQGMSRQDLSGS